MILWYAGLSFIAVALVFGSPALDYRIVMLGSVVPGIELIFAGPWVMHSVLAPIVVITVVMLATMGRRLVRRRWLGLPIGMFCYVALSRAFTKTSLFWWPFFGFDVAEIDTPSLPNIGVVVVLELIGLGALIWAVSRFGLTDPGRRDRFLRTGHLDRSMMGPPPGSADALPAPTWPQASNANGLLQGRVDNPLDDFGLRQAQAAARFIGPVDHCRE